MIKHNKKLVKLSADASRYYYDEASKLGIQGFFGGDVYGTGCSMNQPGCIECLNGLTGFCQVCGNDISLPIKGYNGRYPFVYPSCGSAMFACMCHDGSSRVTAFIPSVYRGLEPEDTI